MEERDGRIQVSRVLSWIELISDTVMITDANLNVTSATTVQWSLLVCRNHGSARHLLFRHTLWMIVPLCPPPVHQKQYRLRATRRGQKRCESSRTGTRGPGRGSRGLDQASEMVRFNLHVKKYPDRCGQRSLVGRAQDSHTMTGHSHSSNWWLLRPVTVPAAWLGPKLHVHLKLKPDQARRPPGGPRPGPAWAECRRTRLGAARVPMNRVAEVAAKAGRPPVAITVK